MIEGGLAWPSGLILLAAMGIVFLASGVQAIIGMGYGLTAAPLLALLDPVFVPATTLMVGAVSGLYVAFGERTKIRWSEVGFGMVGRVTGIVIASVLLAGIQDTSAFLTLFGLCVGAGVLLSLAGWRMEKNSNTLFSMGTVSGAMGTVTGVGAPPMAVIYQDSKPDFARPTLAAFFGIGCVASVAGLAVIGWIQLLHGWLFLCLLPAMFAGTWAARAFRISSTGHYRLALLLISGVASVMLIVKGLA